MIYCMEHRLAAPANRLRVVVPNIPLKFGSDCGVIRLLDLDGVERGAMYMSGCPDGDWVFEQRLAGHYREYDDEWMAHDLGAGYRVVVESDIKLPTPIITHGHRELVYPRRHHSVAVGNVGSAQLVVNAGTGGISWSHTTGSGANRLLTISGGVGCGGSATPTLATTYNAVSQTAGPTDWFDTGGGTYRPRAFVNYTIAPNTGAQTAAVTFNSTLNSGVVGSIDWTGVHQTTPIAASPIQAHGQTVGGTALQSNGAMTTPTNGALIDAFYVWVTGTLTANHTSAWGATPNDPAANNNWGGTQYTLTSGSQTMGWTCDSGAARDYVHVVAGIQEAAGGGGGVTGPLVGGRHLIDGGALIGGGLIL